MFTTGWAAARRRSACRTADVLALKAHNLDATTFGSAPQISATLPQRHRQFCASSSLTEGTRALDVAAVGVQGRGASGPINQMAGFDDPRGSDRPIRGIVVGHHIMVVLSPGVWTNTL